MTTTMKYEPGICAVCGEHNKCTTEACGQRVGTCCWVTGEVPKAGKTDPAMMDVGEWAAQASTGVERMLAGDREDVFETIERDLQAALSHLSDEVEIPLAWRYVQWLLGQRGDLVFAWDGPGPMEIPGVTVKYSQMVETLELYADRSNWGDTNATARGTYWKGGGSGAGPARRLLKKLRGES